ncbi:WD40 repeat-like protein [Rhizoclosmatium globosum]|uniref:Cleavage stimulation factor 50 kDa subunit n=1 Tax=Rhizoclosmatium globosum TaxID=329046 RepID=A0A1Y2CYI0_9FUNG|nr:WD40 repeat-like protein [Rhizoclosmatium globosum]|eukprot:ORY52102.1 WD40 repeat-like protein [Rhizoclosmatium globosum]
MASSDVSALLGLLAQHTPAQPDSIASQTPTLKALNDGNSLSREQFLIYCSQLLQFGLTDAAQLVQQASVTTTSTGAPAAAPQPSNALAELVAQSKNRGGGGAEDTATSPSTDSQQTRTKRIVLETHSHDRPARAAPSYTSWFATQHKGAVRGAAFNADGTYFATCSADNSLKVLDVAKIHACHRDPSNATADKPAIRTFYDHQAPANDVAFHPNGTILVSCSDDMTIKLYDLQRPNVKRGFRYLQDASPVRCVSFHPTGDYLLAGTDHECVRIYDVQTFKCFRPSSPPISELSGSITKAQFSPQGSVFACVNSIQFSKNGKWLLSCGLDSLPRIWDMGSGRVLQTFEGSTQRTSCINATFSQKDELVLSLDDSSNSIVAWDTKTGQVVERVGSLHANSMRSVIASPVDSGFVTVSDDCRARYWFSEEELTDRE